MTTTVNLANLIYVIQRKINSSSNENELLTLSKALQQLQLGYITTVSTVTDLPVASNYTGTMYYVENTKKLYFSTGSDWIDVSLYHTNNAYPQSQLFSWGNGVSVPTREGTNTCNWCSIASGVDHDMAITRANRLFTRGSGTRGVLGNGNSTNLTNFTEVLNNADDYPIWCQASGGWQTSAAVKKNGTLWTWGNANYGALGDGTTDDKCSPVREVSSSTDWCLVDTAGHLTGGIKTSGQLWMWGHGYQGALGNNSTICRCSPVREVSASTNWCALTIGKSWGYPRNGSACVGTNFARAIKTTGQLWSWGNNYGGILLDGSTVTSRSSPVREKCSASDWCSVVEGFRDGFALKTSGQLWRLTRDCTGPVQESTSSTDWLKAGLSNDGVCAALKTNGTIFLWGADSSTFGAYGSLGQGVPFGKGCNISIQNALQECTSSTNWYDIAVGLNGKVLALKNVTFN